MMSLRSQLGRLRSQLLCAVYRRPAPLGSAGPVVSFTFDDFPRSALTTGGAILEKHGARGTYYLAAGLMNGSNELGEICGEEEVHLLLKKGHELGTQTYHHNSCRSVSLSVFRRDVQQGMQAVERFAGHNGSNFAYPYGHFTLRSKKILGPSLTSSRSILPGHNGPEIDLNLLKANRLYGDLEERQRIEEMLLENAKQKTWLIFYTHDVRPHPSPYGCTPELFEFAVSKAVGTGSRIVTVQARL